MTVRLFDIFIQKEDKSIYSKKELPVLEIKKDFIDRLSLELQLSYNALDSHIEKDNLCFAHNRNLRPEFKLSFSKFDIIQYVTGHLKTNQFDMESDEVPFPKSTSSFFN